MFTLWNKDQEKEFFIKSLEFATPEQLFYITKNKKYLAYWPKNYDGAKTTLQSRNSLIGSYTEKWATDLFSEIAKIVGGYVVQGVIAEEIGLSNQSRADIAICKTKNLIQKPENILMIIEVKMSVVWNWEFNPATKSLVCIGDYKTHQGNPGLLRSDTMLKAIGKSINIRVSSFAASKIPIIIVGNTPITKSYYKKVDHLKRNGIIQGFWSINPVPLDNNGENIKSTPFKGFYRFDEYEELKQNAVSLLKEEREFFSSMQTRRKLGEIIDVANKETTYEAKAQKFLELLRQSKE
jgi:hypothetical protein